MFTAGFNFVLAFLLAERRICIGTNLYGLAAAVLDRMIPLRFASAVTSHYYLHDIVPTSTKH